MRARFTNRPIVTSSSTFSSICVPFRSNHYPVVPSDERREKIIWFANQRSMFGINRIKSALNYTSSVRYSRWQDAPTGGAPHKTIDVRISNQKYHPCHQTNCVFRCRPATTLVKLPVNCFCQTGAAHTQYRVNYLKQTITFLIVLIVRYLAWWWWITVFHLLLLQDILLKVWIRLDILLP